MLRHIKLCNFNIVPAEDVIVASDEQNFQIECGAIEISFAKSDIDVDITINPTTLEASVNEKQQIFLDDINLQGISKSSYKYLQFLKIDFNGNCSVQGKATYKLSKGEYFASFLVSLPVKVVFCLPIVGEREFDFGIATMQATLHNKRLDVSNIKMSGICNITGKFSVYEDGRIEDVNIELISQHTLFNSSLWALHKCSKLPLTQLNKGHWRIEK